ncbi:hypothetical protein NHX12_019109 [Muraenolepis orangiensis]|uniref:Uncharacterized protein n=1 Tax=Muraenolepis orangiensis TaxID=630683 RepID=A0A9Q0ITL2_9TELE|nr:hypothetical protein NHX12_019109 [Muraenolepis orangiensis]
MESGPVSLWRPWTRPLDTTPGYNPWILPLDTTPGYNPLDATLDICVEEQQEDDELAAADSAQFRQMMSPPVCDSVGRAHSPYSFTRCLETGDGHQPNRGAPCMAAIQAEEGASDSRSDGVRRLGAMQPCPCQAYAFE